MMVCCTESLTIQVDRGKVFKLLIKRSVWMNDKSYRRWLIAKDECEEKQTFMLVLVSRPWTEIPEKIVKSQENETDELYTVVSLHKIDFYCIETNYAIYNSM